MIKFFIKKVLPVILSFTLMFFSFSCKKTNGIEFHEGFSVHFLDVGEGDCIFVRLPDGKNMLVDSADRLKNAYKTVRDALNVYSVSKIDYFILTHTDNDHIGNAVKIIENYQIGKMYIPDIRNLNYFPDYKAVKEKAESKNIDTSLSQILTEITGEDYGAIFLSPTPNDFKDSFYSALNGAIEPSVRQINDISAVLYLQYKGVRFLLMGDAGEAPEKAIMNFAKTDYYNRCRAGDKIDLKGVEFVKVGNHGDRYSLCSDFLNYVQPKNAVISVAGNNYYGLPSTELLSRIEIITPDCIVHRTDMHGTISVFVSNDGVASVKTYNE